MATKTETETDFVDQTTLKTILNISDEAMDQAMGIGYQLYLTGRYAEAEILCKGLVACDHRYWWSHSLHASVLRRLGRLDEALCAVEEGLKYEPGQPKLALMRAEMMITLARNRPAADSPTAKVTERDEQLRSLSGRRGEGPVGLTDGSSAL